MWVHGGLGWIFRKRNRKLRLVPQGATQMRNTLLSGTFPIRLSKPLERKYALYCTKLEDWLFWRVWSWKRNKWSRNLLIKPDPNQRGSALIDLEENSVVERPWWKAAHLLRHQVVSPHFPPLLWALWLCASYKKGISSEVFERLNQTCPVWARELSVTLPLWILSWSQMTFAGNITTDDLLW